MRELPLGMFDRNEVEGVVTEAGDEIFHMDTEMGGNLDMTGIKDPFDNGIRSFYKGTGSADRTISPFIFLGQLLSPYCPSHGFIHRSKGDRSEIPFVPVYRLTFLGEIDLAVVH